MKECMLKIQTAVIRKLMIEENCIKSFMKTFKLSDIDFNKRVRDVKEKIQTLQY